ncbi:hypothetical protein Scani_34730 [Streptomyces caniferus]|uniref:Uncharacterized protein n=1 Tax=Streptomyces caniferus TaxID=285557 RepID=A0A640SC51_9ACTN|nr:hypothetical protein Scani_34730 [Streptomyces caniferus]
MQVNWGIQWGIRTAGRGYPPAGTFRGVAGGPFNQRCGRPMNGDVSALGARGISGRRSTTTSVNRGGAPGMVLLLAVERDHLAKLERSACGQRTSTGTGTAVPATL